MLNRLLRFLLLRRPPKFNSDEKALWNYALELAQEWGEEWLQPVQERLSKVYPMMQRTQLDELNSLAQQAMKRGHDLAYDLIDKLGENESEKPWRELYQAEYPWVDERNLSHLLSTGSYYAWKDGIGV
jgi:hypothetical protein